MKKLLLVCLALMSYLCMQAVFVPNATSYYKIIQSVSNNAIGLSTGTQPAVMTPAVVADQAFRFVPAGATDTYYLKTSNGLYLSKKSSSSWDTDFLSSPTNDSKWVITGNGLESSFRLKNVTRNAYLASDATGSGSALYDDKAVDNPKGEFKLIGEPNFSFDALQSAIEDAQALKSANTVGTNPGQYTQAAIDAFQSGINAAIQVRDNASATSQDKANAVSALATATTTFVGAINQIKVSTTGNDTWYYIVSTNSNPYSTGQVMVDNATGNNKINWAVKDANLNKYWRFVAGANGTYKIQNRASEMYIGNSVSWSNVTLATTGNDYTVTFLGAGQINIFEQGKTPLHAAYSGSEVVSWEGGLNSASSWKLEEAPVVVISSNYTPLKLLIAQAKAMTTTQYPLGTTLGTYSQTAWTALGTAITTAEQYVALGETDTQANVDAQKALLKTAVDNVKNSCVMPTVSTNYSSTWYTFKAPRPTDTYMTSGGAGANTTSTALITPTSDTQLWKVVTNGAGIALVNKATGEYVNADAGDNTSLGTKATVPTNTLRFIPSTDVVNGAIKFWVENTVGGSQVFRLHAGGSYPMNWTGNANDNCTWQLTEVSTTILGASDFTNAVTTARALYNNTVAGTEYAQYPTSARSAFNAAIAIEEAKTPASLTPEQVYNAIEGLKAVTATYVASVNSNPAATPTKWYTLESAKYPGKFLTLDPATKVLTAVAKDNSDNQLFRFENKPSLDKYTNLYTISCKSLLAGNIRCNSGWDVVYDTNTNFPTDGTYNYVTMGYWPWNLYIVNGVNGTQTLLQSADYDVIAVNSAAGVIGNAGIGSYDGANAWKIVLVSQDFATSTNNSTAEIKVTAVNRMLVITGTTEIPQAYTITGAQVNATKALNPGIYIVKVAGKTVKVNVQ